MKVFGKVLPAYILTAAATFEVSFAWQLPGNMFYKHHQQKAFALAKARARDGSAALTDGPIEYLYSSPEGRLNPF